MNYTELVAAVAAEGGVTKKDTKYILNTFIRVLERTLVEGEDVRINNIGSFKVKNKAEYTGYNPVEGKPIIVPAHNVIKFVPCDALADKVK